MDTLENKVYVVKCADYDQAQEKIRELFSMMGGIGSFASPQEKIMLKVNLLKPAKPEQAITTNPAIVQAVAVVTKEQGALPIIVDSPGSGDQYNERALKTIYETCGMRQAAEASGAQLNFDTSSRPVSFQRGKLIKHFDVITPLCDAGCVFNLCKLKTHVFMGMTGAVKNNFGIIPGLMKPGYHLTLSDAMRFADMLLDLTDYVSPRISIMDAVIGLEGDGPGTAGIPRHIGLILGSKNPLAMDIIAGEIIGLRREHNPIVLAAEKRRLSPAKLEDIQLIGADLSEIRIQNYKFPSTIFEGAGFGDIPWHQRLLLPFFKTGFARTPHIKKEKCIACGICRDSCPMKVISIKGGTRKYAHIKSRKCIRCYCCHELCPKGAVELKESFLYRKIIKPK
jgi:uncharacterized protein (DUF362 family)/NAD-dependent dihydropyrimidine dehydrogenase PreA subunit